jgi:hypothetical protein
MRLLCFFGSGVSQPSDLPMSKEITAALFEPSPTIIASAF